MVEQHTDTCMNAVGFIDKQVLPLEDAWFVEYNYSLTKKTIHYITYEINRGLNNE